MTRSMGAILRRLSKLEKRVRVSEAHPWDPDGQITSFALRQVSDEHLELLIGLGRDRESGLCRAISESESAALAAYEAARQAMSAASQSRKSD